MRTLTRLVMSMLVLVVLGTATASGHGGTLRLAITQDEGTLTPDFALDAMPGLAPLPVPTIHLDTLTL